MIKKEYRLEEREKMVGGDGITQLYHLMEKEELGGHGRLFAKNVLKPGCSIGWHVHTGEFEAYYMLKGEAIFEDNDHSKNIIQEGDLALIESGQGHAIENRSNKDVEFIALVLFETKA